MDLHQYYHINKNRNLKTVASGINPQNIHQVFASIRQRKQQIFDELKLREPLKLHQLASKKYQLKSVQQNQIKHDNLDIQEEMLARGNVRSQYNGDEDGDSKNLYVPLSLNVGAQQWQAEPAESKLGKDDLEQRRRYDSKALQVQHLQYLEEHNFSNQKNLKPFIQSPSNQYQPLASSQYYKHKSQSLRKDLTSKQPSKIIEEKLPYINNKKLKSAPLDRYKTLPSDQTINDVRQTEQIVKRFVSLAADLRRASKTNQRVQQLVRVLEQFNPFFRKIQRVIGVSLIRIGTIFRKYSEAILYEIDHPYDHFYIILSGQVRLLDRNQMSKVCSAGQTILEQVLLRARSTIGKSEAIQKAKLSSQVWLLQIKISDFEDLQGKLLEHGFRRGLQQLRAVIMRNFVVKNYLRKKWKSVLK